MPRPATRIPRSALSRTKRKAAIYNLELKKLDGVRVEVDVFGPPEKLLRETLDVLPRRMKASVKQSRWWNLFYRQMYARYRPMVHSPTVLKRILMEREKMQRVLHAFQNQMPVEGKDIQEVLAHCAALAHQRLRVLEYHAKAGPKHNLTRIQSPAANSRKSREFVEDIILIRKLQRRLETEKHPVANHSPRANRFHELQIPRTRPPRMTHETIAESLGGVLQRGLARQYEMRIVSSIGRQISMEQDEKSAREWMDLHQTRLSQ